MDELGNSNNQYNQSGYNGYEQNNQYGQSGYNNYEQNNMYNQSGYTGYVENNNYSNYNNQQNYNMNNTKPKKVKKKKKHRFLKFLLFVAIIIGLVKLNGWYVQSSFDKFVVDYPFTSFENDGDNAGYVTGNFSLYNYKTNVDKNVTWKSSDKNIVKIDDKGNATVTRPEDSSKIITITGTYKFLLGKAYQKYDITVISSKAQNPEDFTVVTKEELENKTYNRNMKATLDESGNITSMYGDFKDTYIYSAEDGLALIEAYRTTLDLNEVYEFSCSDINESSTIKTLRYIGYYNGIRDDSQSIMLTVDAETFELININCEIDNRNNIVDTNGIQNYDYKKL